MTPRRPTNDWQTALKLAVRDPAVLCRMLHLPDDIAQAASQAASKFPMVVPLEYIAHMRVGDPRDPLLRHVLPVAAEMETVPGYTPDPVGDDAATLLPGLLQKYARRVLMVTTGACAVHCRYCFRRQYPYHQFGQHACRWQDYMQQLHADPTIDEVILSGGDPLMLSDSKLASLVEQIAAIAHVRRLRLHTRLPIVLPQRITGPLVELLAGGRLTTVIVVHANHAAELDEHVAKAIGRLVHAGIVVLNQSVLLRHVNDQARTLIELSQRLVELHITPYYLHQLDRVAGAAHFEVPVARGLELLQQMRAELPGYAVPRYVHEQVGALHKIVLA